MLKSCGVGWVAHVILVSAQGPNPSFFFFCGTFIQLGALLGQGLELAHGPGLDNFRVSSSEKLTRTFKVLVFHRLHAARTEANRT